MDLSVTKELSIQSIIHYWFRYYPRETLVDKRKYRDESKRINKLLSEATDDGSLTVRFKTTEIFIPCYPNSFTGKFATDRENNLYQGLAYDKKTTTTVGYVTPHDLAQFLRSIDKKPPDDSPLITDWLANAEPQTETLVDVGAGSDAEPTAFIPRTGGYGDRDKEAIRLVEDNPELLEMRPAAIKKELKANKLFLAGYPDWWRHNPIFPKGTAGANPK